MTSQPPKIYIAGSGGMLGDAFYKVFSKQYDLKCTDIDTNTDWLHFLDFRRLDAYMQDVENFHPDYLFHLGAHTSLEYCELHPDDAYLTNTLAVENAVFIANKLDVPLLYISTAGIYDGKREAYDDWDTPNPLGIYARSKYMAELYVQYNCRRHLICRAGWMMGGGPNKDKKFINKLSSQIKAGATEIFVVNDKTGTPTYTVDFARNVKLLLETELWGLYNMVCTGVTSRHEVAQEMLKILNFETKIKLTPVASDYFSQDYFAPRPPCERLLNKKLDLRNVNIMRPWRTCLDEYLKSDFTDYFHNCNFNP